MPVVGKQSELGHNQQPAADILHRPVHFTVPVLKNAQSEYLGEQAVEILLGIPLRDAEQNQEASPDFADRFAADINLCRTDPLKHRFHVLYPAPAGQILSPISDSGIP